MIDWNKQYQLNYSRHFEHKYFYENFESVTHGLDDLAPFKRLCKLIKYYSCEKLSDIKYCFKIMYDVYVIKYNLLKKS